MVAASLFERCAIRQPPPGGPEDKTPPKLLFSLPAADSVNIRHLDYLEFQFDEIIDRSSIRGQVWLLPEMPNEFEIKWKGNKKFRVVLKDSLEKDQTYILTVGTGLKDLRGNNLDEPVVIPFSTGPVIDRGEISGQVMGEEVQDVFIYAYQLPDSFPERLVFERKPRYYTQVSKSGEFRLKHLKPAAYRVYALDDRNGDRLYTLQTDWIGIPHADVSLTPGSPEAGNINFTLIQEDTTAPELIKARSLSERRVEISFNEELDALQHFEVTITDSLTQSLLKVLAAAIDEKDASKLIVFIEPQKETTYTVAMPAVKDAAGNYSEGESLRAEFKGTSKTDTTAAKIISVFPGNGQKNIAYNSPVRLQFSLPVDTVSLKTHFQLMNQDTLPVAGHWKFLPVSAPQFIPDTLLNKGESYLFTLDWANIYSVFENSFGDSAYTYQFSAWDWAELGEVSGTVYTREANWNSAILEIAPFKGENHYSLIAATNRAYHIPFLPDDVYRMKAIIDVNGNGQYDRGSSNPFEFSEPFLFYPDTVKVRKRWTTDGINFKFNP